MRIAISSTGPDLDAQVDPRFGRCQCFVVVDPATEELEVLDNEAAMMSGGAGIQAAQMVANSGVDAVITGNLGPNAADTLEATGGMQVPLRRPAGEQFYDRKLRR